MADSARKTGYTQRSRAACTHCRTHKQKCDGPSRIPCRRCELYGLDCAYLPASGPVRSGVARPAAEPARPFISRAHNDDMVSNRLREITDRLRSIETSLANAHLSSGNYTSSASDSMEAPLRGVHSTSSISSPSQGDEPPSLFSGESVNAVVSVSETVDLMAPLGQGGTDMDDLSWLTGDVPVEGARPRPSTLNGLPNIDVIDRGIMTADEVNFTYDIFHRLLAPWLLIFDRQRDTNAMVLRDRSPILFHVVLLSTTYYRMGSSSRATLVYHSLVGIVNELIAPMLISTQPYHLKPDLVRALCILTLYKPIQFAELHAAGITDPIAAEQASKLNATSSSTIWNLMIRTAHTLNLAAAPNTFSKIYQPNVAVSPTILNELRLWAWLVVVDTHGCLTTGRTSSVDPSDLLKVTRILASLKSQIGDVRLAATVELYAIVRDAISSPWYTIIGGTGKKTPAYELRKFNRDVDEWERFWGDKLDEAAQDGDALAATAVCMFSNFVKVIINSSVFTRWRNDRKESLSRGGNGRPELLEHDWHFIQVVLDSTERLVFSVSVESRVEGSLTKRKVQWPVPALNEARRPLTLDETIVNSHKTALDPVTCVVYVYPMIIVAKMANAALIRCELSTDRAQVEYAIGSILHKPRRIVNGAKLGVLLELCAKLLDAISPTPSHPARRHARMLRAVFAAGTMGQCIPVGPNPEDFSSRFRAVLDPSQLAALAPGPPPAPVAPAGSPENLYGEPLRSTQQPTEEQQPIIVNEAGQAMATVLGGIDSSYFGDAAAFSDMDLGGGLDGIEGMVVDWESLESDLESRWAAERVSMGRDERLYSRSY